MFKEKINTRTTIPVEFIGKSVVIVSFGPYGVLDIGVKKYPHPACRNPCPHNSIKRAGAERQVVPMDSAFGRILDIDFIQFFTDASGIPRWKLNAGDYVPCKVKGFVICAISQ